MARIEPLRCQQRDWVTPKPSGMGQFFADSTHLSAGCTNRASKALFLNAGSDDEVQRLAGHEVLFRGDEGLAGLQDDGAGA